MEAWKSFEWSGETVEYEEFKPNLACFRMLQPLQFNQYDPDPWGENARQSVPLCENETDDEFEYDNDEWCAVEDEQEPDEEYWGTDEDWDDELEDGWI